MLRTFRRRIARDGAYRMVCTAALQLGINLLYALYNAALGIAGRSVWFLSMFAYYAILSMARFAVVLCAWNGPSSDDTARFASRLTGWLLAALSLLLTAIIFISLRESKPLPITHTAPFPSLGKRGCFDACVVSSPESPARRGSPGRYRRCAARCPCSFSACDSAPRAQSGAACPSAGPLPAR